MKRLSPVASIAVLLFAWVESSSALPISGVIDPFNYTISRVASVGETHDGVLFQSFVDSGSIIPGREPFGPVAFTVNDTSPPSSRGQAVFSGSGEPFPAINKIAQPTGTTVFGPGVIGATGQLAFSGVKPSGDQGIYRGDNVSAVTIADTRTPIANSTFGSFNTFDYSINKSNDVAFISGYNCVGNTCGTLGVFTGNGSSIATVARSGESPILGFNYSSFGLPRINTAGDVAFVAYDISSSKPGLFVKSDGQTKAIALSGTITSVGTLIGFDDLAFNASGEIAFRGFYADFNNKGSEGIFLAKNGVITPLIDLSSSTPYGEGQYWYFGPVSINDAGNVAMLAHYYDRNANPQAAILIWPNESSTLLDFLDTQFEPTGRIGKLQNLGITDFSLNDFSFNDPSYQTKFYGSLVFRGVAEGGSDSIYVASQALYVSVLPEPSTFAILGIGLLGLFWNTRRKA